MNILLDAYHLQQLYGSGITTHSACMAAAIQQLGHQLHILYGLETSLSHYASRDEFIAAIMSQSTPRQVSAKSLASVLKQQSKRYKFITETCWTSFFGPLIPASQVPSSIAPVPTELLRHLPEAAQLWNSPSIFRRAQIVAAAFGRLTPVHFAAPVPKIDLLQLCDPGLLTIPKAKKAVTVHDLIPLTHPAYIQLDLKRYRRFMRLSLQKADLVFTVSQYSKNTLIELLGIPEQKISVSYTNSVIAPQYLRLKLEQIQPTLDSFGLKIAKYFLYFGNIEPKKNVPALLKAFLAASTDCKIVVVGRYGWLYGDVEAFFAQHQNDPRFVRIPFVPFETLMHLLKGARALAFPSLCEGFGLPVLEAMQLGCPVLTSHVCSLPEVGGDAAHYVDPLSQTELISGLEKLAQDDDYCHKLSQKGLIQAQKFSLENFQRRLQEGYSKIF